MGCTFVESLEDKKHLFLTFSFLAPASSSLVTLTFLLYISLSLYLNLNDTKKVALTNQPTVNDLKSLL